MTALTGPRIFLTWPTTAFPRAACQKHEKTWTEHPKLEALNEFKVSYKNLICISRLPFQRTPQAHVGIPDLNLGGPPNLQKPRQYSILCCQLLIFKNFCKKVGSHERWKKLCLKGSSPVQYALSRQTSNANYSLKKTHLLPCSFSRTLLAHSRSGRLQ